MQSERTTPGYVSATLARLSPLSGLLREMSEEGIDPESDIGERTVELFMARASGKSCTCGSPMAQWEALNRRCGHCSEADLARSIAGRKVRTALEDAGVPPRYLHYTLGNWQGDVERTLLDWAHSGSSSGFCLISGKTGRGKTHLAMILLDQAAQSRQSIAWASARTLPGLLMDDRRSEDRALTRKMQFTRTLLVDDLGAEPGKPWAAEVISDVLDFRFQHGRKTILTSNITAEEIYAANPRIGSRIMEGVIYAMPAGKDWRLKG